MSKKQIGIPGWINSGMFGITQPYAEFINRFGNLVILSPNDDVREDLDMIVVPGGADVNPSRFGSDTDVSFYVGNSNPMLEHFDTHKLPEYLKMGLGVLSICRGSQSIWTMMGGKLNQHYPYHIQSDHQKHECHHLEWADEKFKKSFGEFISLVNSRHHQTMDATKGIPEALEVLAYAKEIYKDKSFRVFENIVEIFRSKNGQILGYQGHPEDMPNDGLTPIWMEKLLNFKNSGKKVKSEELV